MSPEEFQEKMREAQQKDYGPIAHEEMDVLMAKLLRSLGYGEGIDIYDELTKWYE